ncbi:L-seryl-tRNA(Sec) selenium transferase, partial [Halomonas sp. AOP7-E1-9]
LAPCVSQLGSGSLPIDRLPSYALVWRPLNGDRRARERCLKRIETAFRQLPRPVIGRLNEGALYLDLRCLYRPEDVDAFAAQFSILKQRYESHHDMSQDGQP